MPQRVPLAARTFVGLMTLLLLASCNQAATEATKVESAAAKDNGSKATTTADTSGSGSTATPAATSGSGSEAVTEVVPGPVPALDLCPADLPDDLAPGVVLSGKVSDKPFAWSCAPADVNLTRQTPKVQDPSEHGYNIVCLSKKDPANRLSFWLRGPVVGTPFSVKMPWASSSPNVSAQVRIGNEEIEQDSFSIEQDYLRNIAVIVWAFDAPAVGAHRLRGCVEASFNATAARPGGDFLIRFDVEAK